MVGSDPGDEVEFTEEELDDVVEVVEAEISPELVVVEPDPAPEFAYEWTRVISGGQEVYWAKEGDIWLVKREENGDVRRMASWDFAQKYLDGKVSWG